MARDARRLPGPALITRPAPSPVRGEGWGEGCDIVRKVTSLTRWRARGGAAPGRERSGRPAAALPRRSAAPEAGPGCRCVSGSAPVARRAPSPVRERVGVRGATFPERSHPHPVALPTTSPGRGEVGRRPPPRFLGAPLSRAAPGCGWVSGPALMARRAPSPVRERVGVRGARVRRSRIPLPWAERQGLDPLPDGRGDALRPPRFLGAPLRRRRARERRCVLGSAR